MTEDPIIKQHVGILIGILAAVIMLLMLVIFIITVRHRQRKHTTPHAILKPIGGTGDNRVTINMKDLALQYQPKYALNGNIYGQVNLDDPDKLLYQEPADFKAPIYPATYSNGEQAAIFDKRTEKFREKLILLLKLSASMIFTDFTERFFPLQLFS